MDHKTWLWRKRSSEKTIIANDKANIPFNGNEEEVFLKDKAAHLGRSEKNLNEKQSSALFECKTKDELVVKHEKMVQEAIAGWEKAEAEAVTLKQDLNDSLQQRAAAEERLVQTDSALRECMQQLRFVREEQEHRIHDAVMKTSREFEKARMVTEEKLAETNKRLAKLGVENTHLSNALQVKEKLIQDLVECKSQAEADFNALMSRLVSMEKDNTSLRYEVCMLEKELEIRNEERDFNRISVDASHKQHLESVKKIAKLETECQRLRLLVRKRLPGPAALAKMKNEVEMLGRDPAEARRRKSNPTTDIIVKDFAAAEYSPDTPSKRMNSLIERLCTMEEENKTLKETLTKKDNELQSSIVMYARTSSKLAQVEAQLGELSKSQNTMQSARSTSIPHEHSIVSVPNIINEDQVSCAGSWASALISELEHFRNGNSKVPPSSRTVGASDMSLMDDFVEMEKLAIVSVDKPSDESTAFAGPSETESVVSISDATGKELVPVGDSHFNDSNEKFHSKEPSSGKSPDWLPDILKMILEQNNATQRSPEEILEAIRIGLAHMNHSSPGELVDGRRNLHHTGASDSLQVSGCISWKSPNTSPMVDSFDRVSRMNISSKETSVHQLQSNLTGSIYKIIELIEGTCLPSLTEYNIPELFSESNLNSIPYKNLATQTGYMVRVFQWKSSELSSILQQFVSTCNDLLNGKADFEKFFGELTSALDWIMNHCFSLQDVSSMRYTLKKHFEWDESRSETEIEIGTYSPASDAEKVRASEEQSFSVAASKSNMFQMVEYGSNLKEENRRLKDELTNLESAMKVLEVRLQTAVDKNESLMIQLQETQQALSSVRKELETLKESKVVIEDQIESHKMLTEDLDTQLSVSRVELNEARQKFSSLQVELEDKSNCCEELEATCLELQLQLESVTKKETPMYNMEQDEKQVRTGWEITAASEKLAECQETILNLGKQLKALASPREAALFDKVVSTTPATTNTATTTNDKIMKQRSSLLDQMLAEDDTEVDPKSPMAKEIICNSDSHKPPWLPSHDPNPVHHPSVLVESPERFQSPNGRRHKAGTASVGALAIVPSKKHGGGGGLLRKLLSRKKKGSSKKMSPSFVV